MTLNSISAMLLVGIALAGQVARPVYAASITVTTIDDELNSDGDCSLREAITAANTNAAVDNCPAGDDGATDTITLANGATYSLTEY